VDYDKAVLDLVKQGPSRRQWLVTQLTPKIMTAKTLQKTLNRLTAENKIIKKPKQPEGGRLETWYMLPKHELPFEVDDSRIETAIERLKPLLFRVPTIDELAIEVGISPAEAQTLTYKLAPKTGWYNPSDNLIENSKVTLGEVLVCAARIRDKHVELDGSSKSFDYQDDPHIVEEAKRFLNDYPKLPPSLSEDGEKVKVKGWSSEALRYLGDGYYIPKDRSFQFVIALNGATGKRIS
jgi:hypothetical protein